MLQRLFSGPRSASADALELADGKTLLAWVALSSFLWTGCQKKGPGTGPPAMPAIQVIAVEARRQPVTESLSLVGSLAPNVVVTEVARLHEVSTGLLYTWRKQALAGLLGGFMPDLNT